MTSRERSDRGLPTRCRHPDRRNGDGSSQPVYGSSRLPCVRECAEHLRLPGSAKTCRSANGDTCHWNGRNTPTTARRGVANISSPSIWRMLLSGYLGSHLAGTAVRCGIALVTHAPDNSSRAGERMNLQRGVHTVPHVSVLHAAAWIYKFQSGTPSGRTRMCYQKGRECFTVTATLFGGASSYFGLCDPNGCYVD